MNFLLRLTSIDFSFFICQVILLHSVHYFIIYKTLECDQRFLNVNCMYQIIYLFIYLKHLLYFINIDICIILSYFYKVETFIFSIKQTLLLLKF